MTSGDLPETELAARHRKRLHRYEIPNDGRFLTFSCYRRLPLFANPRIRDAFATALAEARARDRFWLIAWVVMAEHVHLYIMPEPPRGEIVAAMWRLKRDFARLVISRWRSLKAPILRRITDPRGRVRFWLPGGGYDRNIHNPKGQREKVNYIHQNPVERGLVRGETDWKWSSALWYSGVREGQVPIDCVGW